MSVCVRSWSETFPMTRLSVVAPRGRLANGAVCLTSRHLDPAKFPTPTTTDGLRADIMSARASPQASSMTLRSAGVNLFFICQLCRATRENNREQQQQKKSAAGERGKAKQHLSLKKAADLAGRESGC